MNRGQSVHMCKVLIIGAVGGVESWHLTIGTMSLGPDHEFIKNHADYDEERNDVSRWRVKRGRKWGNRTRNSNHDPDCEQIDRLPAGSASTDCLPHQQVGEGTAETGAGVVAIYDAAGQPSGAAAGPWTDDRGLGRFSPRGSGRCTRCPPGLGLHDQQNQESSGHVRARDVATYLAAKSVEGAAGSRKSVKAEIVRDKGT